MGMAVKVRMLLAARGMKIKDLVEKMDPPTTLSNLSGKLKRDNFSENDLIAIAKACDAEYEGFFTLKDTGKMI